MPPEFADRITRATIDLEKHTTKKTANLPMAMALSLTAQATAEAVTPPAQAAALWTR